jgi:CheY-like chemotaxis protein
LDPPAPSAGGSGCLARPLRVLVADDEPLVRAALARLLTRRGHHVHPVADAFEAVAALEEDHFDAVLVDMRMPGDGATVLAWLTERRFGGVTVLMTGDQATDAEGVSDGVRRLQKPFPFPSVIPLLETQQPA